MDGLWCCPVRCGVLGVRGVPAGTADNALSKVEDTGVVAALSFLVVNTFPNEVHTSLSGAGGRSECRFCPQSTPSIKVS